MTLREYLFQNWKDIFANCKLNCVYDSRIPNFTKVFADGNLKLFKQFDIPPKSERQKMSKSEFENHFNCKLLLEKNYIKLDFEDTGKHVYLLYQQQHFFDDFGVEILDIPRITYTPIFTPKQLKDFLQERLTKVDLQNKVVVIDNIQYNYQTDANKLNLILLEDVNRFSPISLILDVNVDLLQSGIQWLDSNTIQIQYEDCEFIYVLPDNGRVLLDDFGIYCPQYPPSNPMSFEVEDSSLTIINNQLPFDNTSFDNFQIPDDLLHIHMTTDVKYDILKNCYIITNRDNKLFDVRYSANLNVSFEKDLEKIDYYQHDFEEDKYLNTLRDIFQFLVYMIILSKPFESGIVYLVTGKITDAVIQRISENM